MMQALDDLKDNLKKIAFFITAFCPMGIIFIINYSLTKEFNIYFVTVSSVIITASVMWSFSHLKNKRNTTNNISYFKVVKKYEVGRDMVFHMITYVPVLLIDEFKFSELATFATVMVMIYILYVKAKMLHLNPIILLKYNIYRVIDDHENTMVLFSNLKIRTGQEIPYQETSSDAGIVVN